jgi:hypothetical protein
MDLLQIDDKLRTRQSIFCTYCHDFGVTIDRVWIGEWPRVLRHELSSPARRLGKWVRIPLEAWMSVCVYSVCAVLCVGRGLSTG